jgi:glycosyltransferase involved in cell wall biosynthesis
MSWLLTRPLRFVKGKLLKLVSFNVPTIILEINNSKFFRTYILVILKRVKPLRKLSKRLLAKARIQKTIESNSFDYEKIYYRSAPQIWQQFDSEKLLLPNAEITCEKPLLSICVSTFNRAHWLQHSIPHLLESTKKYGTLIEVLVVDNASSDDSSRLLNELKSNYNFNLIINPINVGMLGNLAVTAKAASGEFTWILGDDDFIDPDAIESILKIIWNHPAINMIYANYSHINFEPDEFRDYLDLRKNSVLIEPDSASFYVERILEMSSKTENFFTAIYCCIFRSDHARKCFEIYDESKPFESLEGCVPTTKYVLDNLLQEPGYWFGKNLITVNTNVSWLRYADLWVLDRFPEIYNRFESAGVPRNEVDKYRKRSIDGVKFHLEDSINKNSTNLINLQLQHLITGYRHLSDFKKNDDFFRTLLKRNTRLEAIYLNTMGASDVEIPGILVEGPFIGSYSLARVNRGVTKALAKSGKNVYISPSPTEGLNFEIPEKFHGEDISSAYFNPSKDQMTEILIRNTFPPTVEKMCKNLNLYHSFGWEESEFPLQYIEDFNKNLDGITVMSSYVKKVLVDNGVRVPISVTGLGIDYIANVPIDNFAKRNFRFLSVSSAFPRKGIDILLRAFVEEFKSDEDVELVLKTFPNIHNDLEIQIAQIQEFGARTPKITLINEDWESDLEVAKLYKSADVVVAPSRGEGFGWAIGEALAYHIPVIATGFGGHLDIIDHSYPWIVDFEFQYSNSHFDQTNSIWVEPNLDHLKKLMRSAFETPKSVRDALGEKYGERALKSNNWEEVSLRIEKFITVCIKNASQSECHTGKTAILTTWEEQCGISEYSQELLKSEEFSETLVLSRISSTNSASRDQVIECWKQGEVEEVLELLRKREIKNLIVQYQPSFFSLFELSKIVFESLNHEINLFIILHNVKDFCEKMSRDLHPIFANRNINFLVHTAADLNQIKKLKPELLQRTIHFPHPNYFSDSELNEVKQKTNGNITISSFGFLHENKGTDLLINIFGEVKKKYPGAKLNLVNAHLDERSTIFKKKCMKLIEELGLTDSVSWTTEFLSFLEIQRVLSKSDLIILPYRETSESSSGAVRVCMNSQVPVLVSESSIFSDVANVVQRSSVQNVPEFSRRVFEILENPDLQLKMVEAQRNFLSSYSFEKMSRKLYNIINAQSQFSRSADML